VRKGSKMACESNRGRELWASQRPELKAMITATWTWTDIRNFEEDASGCQRAQLAWALVLAAALVLMVASFG
jgi:hypothetical protein